MTTVPMRIQPALLASSATVTAACLSVMAGWQRGGFVAERVLMICVGVVLVVAAHLLPALFRSHGWKVRTLGVGLWIGCMAATCYGHAVFFVLAQTHAEDVRAAAVPVVVAPARSLADIARDRAVVVARLARVTERECHDRCAYVRIETATQKARLAALDAESAEVTRREAAIDRAVTERAAAKVDPVTGALNAFGVTASHADLVAGLAFAAVLEGVACFCWLLAIQPEAAPAKAVTPVTTASHAVPVMEVTEASNAVAESASESVEADDDVTRVMKAIAAGTLRGTVTEIRRHLGCSQTRAAAVRRQIANAQEI